MTYPLDAEADRIYLDCCKPGLSIRDTAQAAIRTALEMRDAERATADGLKQLVWALIKQAGGRVQIGAETMQAYDARDVIVMYHDVPPRSWVATIEKGKLPDETLPKP